jgi:hypothetical protein
MVLTFGSSVAGGPQRLKPFTVQAGAGLAVSFRVSVKAAISRRKALSLEESLSEAHVALLRVKDAYKWDWPGAEREFRTAIEIGLVPIFDTTG